MKRLYLLTALLLTVMGSTAQKLVGGDISLLTKYEEKGANFLDHDGNKISDPLVYMKEQGMNTMRLRLFVDPSKASAAHKQQGVVQDLDYVKQLGKRIKDEGLHFLLDLHYSDTWTDPGQHATPSGWSGTGSTLATQLYDYTVSTLQALKDYGAEPDAIQVGNEITYGMLWPSGRVYPAGGAPSGGSWDNLALYIKKGVEACRATCPSARVVIHAEMSGSGKNIMPFFKQLTSYGVDYDVIGLSYYPHYHGNLATLNNILTALENTYPEKQIQLVEAGYYHAWYPSNAQFDYTATYPATEEGQRKFTADLITMLNRHEHLDGLYWWWPETCEYGINYQNAVTPSGWYNAGLWDNQTGCVLSALFELRAFRGADDSHIGDTQFSASDDRSSSYDMLGRPLTGTARPAIVVSQGKKVVNKNIR